LKRNQGLTVVGV